MEHSGSSQITETVGSFRSATMPTLNVFLLVADDFWLIALVECAPVFCSVSARV